MENIDNKKIISDMLCLQVQLNNRINNFITEDLLRKEITKDNIERIKDSLEYILDERFSNLLRNVK